MSNFNENIKLAHKILINASEKRDMLIKTFSQLEKELGELNTAASIGSDEPFKLLSDRIESILKIDYKINESVFSTWLEMLRLSFIDFEIPGYEVVDDCERTINEIEDVEKIPLIFRAISSFLIDKGFKTMFYHSVYQTEFDVSEYNEFAAWKNGDVTVEIHHRF